MLTLSPQAGNESLSIALATKYAAVYITRSLEKGCIREILKQKNCDNKLIHIIK